MREVVSEQCDRNYTWFKWNDKEGRTEEQRKGNEVDNVETKEMWIEDTQISCYLEYIELYPLSMCVRNKRIRTKERKTEMERKWKEKKIALKIKYIGIKTKRNEYGKSIRRVHAYVSST